MNSGYTMLGIKLYLANVQGKILNYLHLFTHGNKDLIIHKALSPLALWSALSEENKLDIA